jgi:hypothetical protein
MDIEVRIAKLEVEVDSNKAAIEKLGQAVEALRTSTERGFMELRTEIRWLMGICLGGFGAIFGLLGRIAGLY